MADWIRGVRLLLICGGTHTDQNSNPDQLISLGTISMQYSHFPSDSRQELASVADGILQKNRPRSILPSHEQLNAVVNRIAPRWKNAPNITVTAYDGFPEDREIVKKEHATPQKVNAAFHGCFISLNAVTGSALQPVWPAG